MSQYDDVEYKLAMWVLHIVTRYGCDHHNAVNRIEIRLKRRCNAIPTSRFIAEHTIEIAPACNVASSVAEAITAELTAYAPRNVIELNVKTLVVP